MHLEGSIEPELLLATGGSQRRAPALGDARSAARRVSVPQPAIFPRSLLRRLPCAGARAELLHITRAYLRRAHADAVIRAEVFVGPQGFTERDVPIAVVMDGVLAALRDAANDDGISAGLLVSAQRHRSEADGIAAARPGHAVGRPDRRLRPRRSGSWQPAFALRALLPHLPRTWFSRYGACRRRRAGVLRARGVELLDVDRIDHGNACMDDPALVRELAARRNSADGLSAFERTAEGGAVAGRSIRCARCWMPACAFRSTRTIRRISAAIINDNFVQCRQSLGLSADEIVMLARNSLTASFVPPAAVARNVARLDAYVASYPDLIGRKFDVPTPSARCAA